MKFKITVEQTKTICPQWQLRIENIKTKLQVCVGHCKLEDKEGLGRLNETRARLELVLN
jgi:hypothetical protein